jgi:hypothetical protein
MILPRQKGFCRPCLSAAAKRQQGSKVFLLPFCLSAGRKLPFCRLPEALETAERQNDSAAAERFLPPLPFCCAKKVSAAATTAFCLP